MHFSKEVTFYTLARHDERDSELADILLDELEKNKKDALAKFAARQASVDNITTDIQKAGEISADVLDKAHSLLKCVHVADHALGGHFARNEQALQNMTSERDKFKPIEKQFNDLNRKFGELSTERNSLKKDVDHVKPYEKL